MIQGILMYLSDQDHRIVGRWIMRVIKARLLMCWLNILNVWLLRMLLLLHNWMRCRKGHEQPGTAPRCYFFETDTQRQNCAGIEGSSHDSPIKYHKEKIRFLYILHVLVFNRKTKALRKTWRNFFGEEIMIGNYYCIQFKIALALA